MSPENMVPTVLLLAPGDVLDISFAASTNLNVMRRIGPEGAITLPIVGQVHAAGRTATELEKELEQAYAAELTDPDVTVNLAGSANIVYVTGSVLRPGRITMERPLTALEAILETGGFMPDANMEKVTVMRYEGQENVLFNLNLKPVYSGEPMPPFYLKPRDVVNVPKKVQWF